jgi:hypothetical protein
MPGRVTTKGAALIASLGEYIGIQRPPEGAFVGSARIQHAELVWLEIHHLAVRRELLPRWRAGGGPVRQF